MGTGKKSTSATRDRKALVKICSCVCGGPGRSKGIWGRGWKSSIWAGCDASSPTPKAEGWPGTARVLFLQQSCPSAAAHVDPNLVRDPPAPLVCRPSEPTPWMVAPAS